MLGRYNVTAKVEANLLSPKRNSTSFGVQWLVRQKGGREESRICLPTAVLVAEHTGKLPQPTTHCEEVRKHPAMRTAPSNEVVTFSAPHAQRNTHRDTQTHTDTHTRTHTQTHRHTHAHTHARTHTHKRCSGAHLQLLST